MFISDVPASGIYFLTYEVVKDFVTDNGTKNITTLGTILAGGLAGVSYWFLGMPPDVLKSRFQTGKLNFFPLGCCRICVIFTKKIKPLIINHNNYHASIVSVK